MIELAARPRRQVVRFHRLKCWGLNADEPFTMQDEVRSTAKAQLSSLLERVMADGKIEQREREDMQKIFRQALLTVKDVQEVFAQFLRGLEAQVTADGVVTEDERRRCIKAVEELKIPMRLMSPGLLAIIRGLPPRPRNN